MFPSVGYTLKREFSSYSRSLQHDKPQEFVTSQWEGKGGKTCIRAYVVYKWALAIYLVTMMILDVADLRSIGAPEHWVRVAKWPVLLTSWNTTLLTVQAVLSVVLISRHYISSQPESNQMSKLHKTYWVVHNIANALAPAVTLLYWTLVYNNKHVVDFFNVHKHLLNSAVVLVDLVVNAHPVRILHVYQPVVVGAGYGLFTFVYFVCGGTSRDGSVGIYPTLDWRRPLLGLLTTVGSCALLVVLHTLLWVLHVARVSVGRALFGHREPPPQLQQDDNALALN